MPAAARSRITLPAGAALPPDAAFIADTVKLRRTAGNGPDSAKKHLFMWLVIEAAEQGTTPGAVLDNLVRSQPSRNDQYGLMRRYRAALTETRA